MKCKANGCPLSVDVITHWHSNEPGTPARPKWGVCMYHRTAKPDDWSNTTARIKAYQNIIATSRCLNNLVDPMFKPLPNETAIDYFRRIENQVERLVLGEVDFSDADKNFAQLMQMIKKVESG